MTDWEKITQLQRIFDLICREYSLGNMTPMIMPFILKEPEKAVKVVQDITLILHGAKEK